MLRLLAGTPLALGEGRPQRSPRPQPCTQRSSATGRSARSPGRARPPSRVASRRAAPSPPVTSVRLHPRAAAAAVARSSVPTRALRTSPGWASGRHLPGAASVRPAAAQPNLDGVVVLSARPAAFSPEPRSAACLPSGTPFPLLSASLRSRDGKSWRRGRLLGRAERAPSGSGASDALSPRRVQQPLVLPSAAS